MLNVRLVSMPYTILTMPSLGIAQITAVVRRSYPDRVAIEPAYCYLDFAEFVGHENYDTIGQFESKGLLDWMFRQAAFDVRDNGDDYREFYFADGLSPRKRRIFDLVADRRRKMRDFLDSLIARYRMAECRVVGFTSMMSQNVASFALARRLKEVNPDVLIVMGGPNCEHPMGRTIVEHVPQVDYVFSGEALVSFPRFIDAVLAGDLRAAESIKGVHTRRVAEVGQAVGMGPRVKALPVLPMAKDDAAACGNTLEENSGADFNLNELPMLDYTEYLERIAASSLRARLEPELIIPFQTSTGCWWADKVPCSFCGLTPHAFRQMTVERAKGYIGELIERYKGRFSIFEATDPCMPIEYARQVFPHVNQDRAAVLQYEVKASTSLEDMIGMASANVILPQPGIESLSTRTLKIMRKGVTGFQNVQFLKRCVEHGMYPIWNYLYGFPNKDYDEFATDKLVHDIQTLYHLPPPSSNIPIGFQRYSEYFNQAERYGLNLRPADFYGYVYPFDERVLRQIGYTFVDDAYSEAFERRHGEIVRAVNLEIVNWMFKFREDIPKLYLESEEVVFDSRYDEPVRRRISPLQRRLLAYLDEPRTLEMVAKELDLPLAQAEQQLEIMQSWRFLFVEGARYLSIVCERCALSGDHYKEYYINFVKNGANAFD